MAAVLKPLAALAALASGAALATGAAAETRPGYGGRVVASLLSEPVSLDPQAAESAAELAVAGLLFDGLYRRGADGSIRPQLAAAMPEVDGLKVRIPMRPGLVFHDGSVLDEGDAAASLRRLARSSSAWLLASVAAIGTEPGAVVLELRRPFAVERVLSLPVVAVTPDGLAPGELLIGSGPFRAVALDRRGGSITLAAWDRYFAGRAFVDQLVLRWYPRADGEARAFETGEAHISLRGATVFAGHSPRFAAATVEAPNAILVYLGFGRRRGDLATAEVRRAVSMALARQGFASGGNEPVAPATVPLADAPVAPNGDLAAAEQLLTLAGRTQPALAADRRGRLPRLEVLIDQTRFEDRRVAERVVVALDRLGLAAAVTAVPAAEFRRRVTAADCELYVGQLVMAAADPALVWAAAFEAGRDPWARQQLQNGDLDAAAAADQFARRMPIVPLYHRGVRANVRKSLRGLAVDDAGRLGLADVFFFGEPVAPGGKPP